MYWSLQQTYLTYFFPMLILLIPANFSEFITLSFAEHLNSNEVVTGLGIAQMTVDCILGSYMYGFASIFEAYAGAIVKSRKPGKLGEVMVKVMLQGSLAYLIMLGPYLNMVHVVHFFGVDSGKTRDMAILNIRLTCACPLLFHIEDLLGKYLAVQGYTKTVVTAGLGHLIAHSIFTWLAVDFLCWGVVGIAIATMAGYLTTILALALFCWVEKDYLLWDGITSDVWRGWREMMKFGNYSGMRVFASFSLYALSNVLCQVGGPVTAASVVILDKINILFNIFVYTGGSAAALIVGNKLGEESEQGVKIAIIVGVGNWVVERTFSIVCLFLGGEYLARMLTDDEQILSEVISSYPVITALYLLFGLDELLAKGFMTPFGMQNIIGIITPVSIFAIGYPLMFYMVYETNTAARGIFACFVITHIIQCLAYLMRLAFVNISHEIVGSSERIERSFDHDSLVCVLKSEDSDSDDFLRKLHKSGKEKNYRGLIAIGSLAFAVITILASFV